MHTGSALMNASTDRPCLAAYPAERRAPASRARKSRRSLCPNPSNRQCSQRPSIRSVRRISASSRHITTDARWFSFDVDGRDTDYVELAEAARPWAKREPWLPPPGRLEPAAGTFDDELMTRVDHPALVPVADDHRPRRVTAMHNKTLRCRFSQQVDAILFVPEVTPIAGP